ncbi:RodZ domain-containing protein [Comamonas sp. GB3 AK4-5]|uniref:helix-turn-helix domain-containing protein n=1 Tax=Comamonas sp. GB3 AK4-5 TaxID=3231487 RepID=UPI00351E47F6
MTELVDTSPAPQTAGSLLRHARESAGMHVSTLADVLKVPVAKLRALEADDWQTLPDAVFTRSLALSICKALQVDATPVMALLPKSAATQKFTAPGPGINEPFRDKAVRSVHDTPHAAGVWKWLALALLAGAGGGAWYFTQQQDLRDAVVASVQERSERAMGGAVSSATPAPAAFPAADVTADQPSLLSEQSAAAPAADVAAQMESPAAAAVTPASLLSAAAPLASEPAVQPQVAPNPTPAPVAVPIAPPAAQDALAGSAATLRIQARAATWIQVRGGGKVLEQKTLNAGEFFETQAAKPLSVVIGRVDAVDVQVSGAVFDLGTVARENVARFEVK